MNKINVLKTIFNITYILGILVIFAVGIVIVPVNVNAQYAGYVNGYNQTRFVNVPVYDQYNSYQGATYPYPQSNTIVPIYYSSDTTPNTSSSTTNNSSTTKTVETNNNSSNTVSNESNTPSNLAANAIYGSNSFAPSGLIQWVLFAILILFIVIIVRKVLGGKDNYHSTPMKHA